MKEETETTLRVILGGLLMNGYIQGELNKKIDFEVLKLAEKEIEKLLTKENMK